LSSRGSLVRRNVLYNLAGQGLLMLLGFIAVKFQFVRLGADAFGIIMFAQTLNVVLVGLLDLGVSATIVREISAHRDDELAYAVSILRTASFVYWAGFVLLSGAVLLLAPLLVTHWIHLQTLDSPTATWIVRVLGVATLTALPRSLYSNVFRGLQQMAVNNGIDVAAVAVQQAGIALILLISGGIIPCVSWLAMTYVLWLTAYVPFVVRSVPWRALVPRLEASTIRRNARFSSLMMLITTLGMVHTQADKVVVSKLLPVETLGYYGFASSVVLRATLLANAIVEAALPSFSVLFKANDRPRLQAQYARLQSVVALSTPPLFALIAFFSLPLFSLLFTPGIAHALWFPVALLCLGQYMNGTLAVPNVFSIAAGKPEISARSNLIALFTVLPVTVVLIFIYGLTGAGLSWVGYHLFAYIYFVPRVCRECLRVSPLAWYRQTGKVLAVITVTYGLGWLVVTWFGWTSVPLLFAGYAGASLAFALGVGLFLRGAITAAMRSDGSIAGMGRAA